MPDEIPRLRSAMISERSPNPRRRHQVRTPTLKDVAARAGVSYQTVGKVLNGKGATAPQTRERILRAADELGYVPNYLARGLIGRNTLTIGLMASAVGDTVQAQGITSVEREARRRGHSVLISGVASDGTDGAESLQSLLERRVDGIMISAPQLESDSRFGELLQTIAGRTPVVSFHPIAGGNVSVVTADFAQAAVLAMRHLLALGHRRIGTVTGPAHAHFTRVRLDPYLELLRDAGIAVDHSLIEPGDWEIEGGYQATHLLLDRAPDVTAIYAQNDLMAVGVLSALHDRGWRVPDDCAVVGCDDQPLAARTIPPLTTVRVPLEQLRALATSLLLDLIRAPSSPAQQIVLPVSLVYRASSGQRVTGDGRAISR
jgi:DNA-binding LacI/PurR family transcriptional regulator